MTKEYMESIIRYVVNHVLGRNGQLCLNVIRIGRVQNFWLSSSGIEMCENERKIMLRFC